MPPSRQNLTIDQQFFQELLSAAYTIQQHNERSNRPSSPVVTAKSIQAPAATKLCASCGETRPANQAECPNCEASEFRPGERMQRKWASMWLLSQQQGLWPERATESGQPVTGGKRPATEWDPSEAQLRESFAPFTGKKKLRDESAGADADTVAQPNGNGNGHRNGNGKPRSAKPTVQESLPEKVAPTSNWNFDAIDDLRDDLRNEDSVTAHSPHELASAYLSPGTYSAGMSDLALDGTALTVRPWTEGQEENALEAGDPDAASLVQTSGDWRVKLRFHRADLYLGVAILVAAFALLWPAAGSTQHAALSPWERALVGIGIAEAPAPAIHVQGDPTIEVWVDPHSAVYYCPGEDLYGKTPDGRFSSQREAQTDRFEPSSRSACE